MLALLLSVFSPQQVWTSLAPTDPIPGVCGSMSTPSMLTQLAPPAPISIPAAALIAGAESDSSSPPIIILIITALLLALHHLFCALCEDWFFLP